MNWNSWVIGFKNYISSNKDNINTDEITINDHIIVFKEDAAADQYDRVTSIQELISLIGSSGIPIAENRVVVGTGTGVGSSIKFTYDEDGELLDIVGLTTTDSIRIIDGASVGYVLKSDADGNGIWTESTIIEIPSYKGMLTSASHTPTGSEIDGDWYLAMVDGITTYANFNGVTAEKLTRVVKTPTGWGVSLNFEAGLIPYTGAKVDVDLGTNDIVANNLTGTNTGDQDINGMLISDGSVLMDDDSSTTIGDYHQIDGRGLGGGYAFVQLDYTTQFTVGDKISIYNISGEILQYRTISEIYLNGTTSTTLTLTEYMLELSSYSHSLIQIDRYPIAYTPTEDQSIATKVYVDGNKPVLDSELITNITVGGLTSNTTLAVNTKLEDVLISMLVSIGISNLTYSGYSSLVKCDSTIVNPLFTWSVAGVPTGLTLTDSLGQLSGQVVTGSAYASIETYSLAEYGTIVWTLDGTNVSSTSKTITFVHESWYGNNTTGLIPTDTEILAGTELLRNNSSYITHNPNTTSNQYGWIAVPQSQTGHDYTAWYVTALNNGGIGSGNFIIKKGTVTVHSDIYDVYMYDYPSELTANLKLS